MGRYSNESEVAQKAVRAAAELYMGNKPTYVKKDNSLEVYDVVSQNDIDAEDLIKEILHSAFLEDSFHCEESGCEDDNAKRKWIIDPIDGTINYVHGIPLFGTQVALAVDGEPVVSVMYLPVFDEMYVAEKGCGAYLNGKKLDVRREVDLKDSLLSIGDYSKGSVAFRENQVRIMDVLHDVVGRIKMMGSSCYDFTIFSAGRTDFHMRFIRNPWDFIPGFLLITEAGAVYDKELYEERKLFIAATSESNLKGLVEIIKRDMVWY